MVMTPERQETWAVGIGTFLTPIIVIAIPADILLWLDATFVEHEQLPWQLYAAPLIVAALAGAYGGRRAFLESESDEWYRREQRRQQGF